MSLDLQDPYTQLVVTDVEVYIDSPTAFVSTIEPNIVSTIECCVKPVRYITDRHSDGFINGMNGNNYFRYGAFTFPRNLKALYVIKDIVTGNWYVGSTQDLGARLTKHLSLLKFGKHPNAGVLELWDDVQRGDSTELIIKYIVFPSAVSMEILRDLEQEILDVHANNSNKLNIALDSRASQSGRHISDSHKDIIRNRVITDETRQKLSLIGKERGGFRKDNRWLVIDGVVYHSITEAEKRLGLNKSSISRRCESMLYSTWDFLSEDDPRYNTKVTYVPTTEQRARTSAQFKGTKQSEAHRAARSAALKGRGPSEATKAASIKARSKSVEINGTIYPSVSAAGRALEVGNTIIQYRLGKFPGYIRR